MAMLLSSLAGDGLQSDQSIFSTTKVMKFIHPMLTQRSIPWPRLLAVALFLAVLFAGFELSGLRDHFSLQFLRDQFLHNRLNGVLIFVALFALGNLIQIPGWIFLAAAVLALGRVWGGALTYLAACLSCALTFVSIRLLGGDALRQLNSRVANRLLAQLDARPIRSMVFLRVLFQTVPALNYALALSGVRFREYMIATLLGLPLPIALYCLFFDFLAQLLRLS
ncbi:MAG: hypothetical protein AW11_02719 [Candidatus Accumulibacter regalis]|uniref:VTT domain-containing protein n=2 Tax=Candidatus Accumulibacter TaxID=327159 RepID=A0A011R7J7_ACCRE|nr:MAG: hypothetical protein AW11_02719 [Candidatus Accumulibacter regalis]